MSLMDKIRREANSPTVKVPPRQDVFVPMKQDAELSLPDTGLVVDEEMPEVNQVVQAGQDPHILSLEAELAKYPVVSSKKVGVRLEEPILEEIQELCRSSDITVETLLESFYFTCKGKDMLMRQVIKDAKSRVQRRTKAGNIRSILTKSKNIRSGHLSS